MKIKFDWGTGIVIFIAIFLLANAVVIYLSFQQKNDLVVKEYYPQGLEYQRQIDRFARANALSSPIMISTNAESLVVKYPSDFKSKDLHGEVVFFRPSDENADFTENIRFDTTMMQYFLLNKFINGKYVAKFFWTMDGKEYAHESTFRINK